MANRNFNRRQSLVREVKDVYAKFTCGTPTSPTGTLATTTAITVTHALKGSYLNGRTLTIVVNSPAANPSATILAAWTGTASAMVLTLTPNDGTNNTATPVTWTSANLAEYLHLGTVTAKTVTTTDTGSLAGQIANATGGNTTVLAHSGNGDGVVATFASGADNVTNNSVAGISSISRNSAGDFSIVLQDAFNSLVNFKAMHLASAAQDLKFQLVSEAVNDSTSKTVRFVSQTGTTATDPASGTVVFVKFELKNTSAS